jgi:hypothetical protein
MSTTQVGAQPAQNTDGAGKHDAPAVRRLLDAAVACVAEGVEQYGPDSIGIVLRGLANCVVTALACVTGAFAHFALGLSAIPSSGVAVGAIGTQIGVEVGRRRRHRNKP